MGTAVLNTGNNGRHRYLPLTIERPFGIQCLSCRNRQSVDFHVAVTTVKLYGHDSVIALKMVGVCCIWNELRAKNVILNDCMGFSSKIRQMQMMTKIVFYLLINPFKMLVILLS